MNIRQEVETAIASLAAAQVPPIPVAYEGVAFTKPQSGAYIQVVFIASTSMNATLDAERQRIYGTFQVNVAVPVGKGMKQLDDITAGVAALFPVNNKFLFTTFSVEQPANVSPSMIDAGFIWAAVRVKYRQEL